MAKFNTDKIVEDIISEALTSGYRNMVQTENSNLNQRIYAANELVAGAASFAHQAPGGQYVNLNNMIQDQVQKLGANTAPVNEDSVGYLIDKLRENKLTEAAEFVEAVCNYPAEEDANDLHKIALLLAEQKVDKFIVNQLHKFAEDVRYIGKLNEDGYDVDHFLKTGNVRLYEETKDSELSDEETAMGVDDTFNKVAPTL